MHNNCSYKQSAQIYFPGFVNSQSKIPNFHKIINQSDCFDKKPTSNKQIRLVLIGSKILKNFELSLPFIKLLIYRLQLGVVGSVDSSRPNLFYWCDPNWAKKKTQIDIRTAVCPWAHTHAGMQTKTIKIHFKPELTFLCLVRPTLSLVSTYRTKTYHVFIKVI